MILRIVHEWILYISSKRKLKKELRVYITQLKQLRKGMSLKLAKVQHIRATSDDMVLRIYLEPVIRSMHEYIHGIDYEIELTMFEYNEL